MLLKRGVAVLENAIPAPNAGCKISNGANTVTIPMRSAGSKDGDRDPPRQPGALALQLHARVEQAAHHCAFRDP